MGGGRGRQAGLSFRGKGNAETMTLGAGAGLFMPVACSHRRVRKGGTGRGPSSCDVGEGALGEVGLVNMGPRRRTARHRR